MANDTVRIENLPDGGSRERVALDLARWVINKEVGTAGSVDRKTILDTYAECLAAAKGQRVWQ